MKVGFCGSQCTGKTTQAEQLGIALGFIVVPSASRLAARMGVPVNREGNLSSQAVIIGKIEGQKYYYAQKERSEYGKTLDLVWERTHVDALAYSQTSDLWDVQEHYLICHRALAEDMMNNYFDMVFYFPAYDLSEFLGEVDDGIRDVDPMYRAKVDAIILAELESLCRQPYITVPNGPPEEVHQFIKNIVMEEKITISMERHKGILDRLAD